MSILQRGGSLIMLALLLLTVSGAALAQAYPPPTSAYPAPVVPQQTQTAFRIDEIRFRVIRITLLRDGCLYQNRYRPLGGPIERRLGCGVTGDVITLDGNAPPVLGWVAFRDCDEFELVNPNSIPDVYGVQRGPCRSILPVVRKGA